MQNKEYVEKLLKWYRMHGRKLPFRETSDPYAIWLSEVIFQQTRIKQGLPYYRKFIQNFPNVYSLAKAKQEKIFSLWQGLGYYRRAENLHKTAKIIVEKYKGKFPKDYGKLKKLPGIGDYIASAIMAFAFNAPFIALDGNIRRVLLRKNAVLEEMYAPETTKKLKQAGQELLRFSEAKSLNEALMDLGAMICLPKPSCNNCPVNKQCQAFLKNLQNQIPVKNKKKKPQKREMHFLFYEKEGKIAFVKRTKDDIWRNLYTFPEAAKAPRNSVLLASTKHLLTHFSLQLYLWKSDKIPVFSFSEYKDFQWVSYKDTGTLPLPTGIRKLLKNSTDYN